MNIVVVVNFADVQPALSALKSVGVTDDPITGVQMAGTPYHGSTVYHLGGVLGPDGDWDASYNDAQEALLDQDGAYFGKGVVDPAGVTEASLKQVLGYLNQGHFEVARRIDRLTSQRGALGEQATKAMADLNEYFKQEIAAVQDEPITDMQSYEKVEGLVEALDAAGLRDFRDDERALAKKMKSAISEQDLKEDLMARQFYQKMLVQSCSQKPKDRLQATEGFRALTEKLPETHYAERAERRLEIAAEASAH